jgi:peptidoglycan/xylan/chitin deacetylase (PgdA/CDA1 family)
MLNHRFVLLISAVGLITATVSCVLQYSPCWTMLLPVLFYLVWAAFGSYFIQLNFYMEAKNRGNATSKKIALTFDDGPIENCTDRLLEILAQKKVKASFFLIGKNIQGNENIVKNMHDAGHLIGSHGFEHHNCFPFYPIKKMIEDIKRGQEAVEKVIGEKTLFFRPPFGVTHPMVAQAVARLRLVVIGWNIRSYDTNIHDEQQLLKKISKARGGDIILLHDWGPVTLKILPDFIDRYHKQGYEFVRADEI